MPKITSCLWLFLLLWSISAVAQSAKADSLLTLLNQSKEDTGKVQLYRKLGAAIIYQDAAKALDYFLQGIVLSKKLQYNYGLERCYTPASLAYSFMGKYDTSLLYSDSAVLYTRMGGNAERLAQVYTNRGDVFSNLQDFKAALSILDTALSFAEKVGDKDRIGRIHSISSDIYVGQKQFDKALEAIDRSIPFFEEVGNAQMLGMSWFGKAEIWQDRQQYPQAEAAYRKAIQVAESVEDQQNLAAYYCGLAQTLCETQKYAQAEAAGLRSLVYAQQGSNRKQEGIVYDLFRGIAMAQKNYPKAIEYALKAYAIIKEEGDLMREQVTALALSEAYSKAGNHAEAYRYLQLSETLKDSLTTLQYNEEIAKQMAAFEVKQKDKEIQLLNKDKELQHAKLQQQKWMLGVSALVAILILVGIGLLINRSRLRHRMKELELRNNIAADLHDEVGSSLSSIHILSQVAAQQTVQDTTHADILSRVSTNARETMEKMSDIVWMIKPGQNDGAGLAQRMQRYIYEMCSSQNIACTLTGEEHLQSVKFTMQQRKNFYLVFKEALNNAVKYSGADNIEVNIELHNKECRLLIRDHGKGFEYDQQAPLNGNGLGNMHTRARESGGQLSIETRPGNGTQVSLTLPA